MDRVQTISTQGGACPVWSHDGRYLYFRDDADLMRVSVDNGQFGAPEYYADLEIGIAIVDEAVYDVDPDGRVVIARRAAVEENEGGVVLLNIGTLLKELDPANSGN